MLCVSAITLVVGVGAPWWSPPSRATAAESAPAPKAKPAPVSPACALVTKAEAEAILGGPLDDLTSPGDSSCDYGHKPDRPHIVMTELRTNETKAQFESETKNVAKMMGAKLKPVSGYGEQAVWIGDFQIIVLQHGKAISVAQPGAKLAPAKLDAFLRKALSRM